MTIVLEPVFRGLVRLSFYVLKLREKPLARLFDIEEVPVDQRLAKRSPHLEQYIGPRHARAPFLSCDFTLAA